MLRFLTQKLRHQTLNEISPLPPTNEPSPSPATSDLLACACDTDKKGIVDTNGGIFLGTSCWSAAALSTAAAADCAGQEQHRRLIDAELDDVDAEPSVHQPPFLTPQCIAGTTMATDHSVEQLPAADVTPDALHTSGDVGSKSRAKRKRPKLGRGAAVLSGGGCCSTATAAAADSAAAVATAAVATAMASPGNTDSRYCSSDSSSDEEVVELLSGRRAAVTRPAVAFGDAIAAAAAAAAGATPMLATDAATCITDDEACCCCCRKSTSELDAEQLAVLGSQARPVVGSEAAVAPATGGDCCCCCRGGFGKAQSDTPPCSSLTSGLCATEDAAAAAASSSSGCASLLTHAANLAVSPRKRPHCAAAAGHTVDGSLRLRPVLRQHHLLRQQQPADEDGRRSRHSNGSGGCGTVLVSRPSLDLEKMHQKAAAFKRHYPRTIRIRCWNAGSNAGSCPMPEPLHQPSDFLFRSLDTVLVAGSHLTPVERPSACSV